MRRLAAAGLLAGVVLLFSACGDGAGDATTTSVVTSSSTTSTTVADSATSTTTDAPVLSDLTGNWANERAVLRVSDAGDYVVLGPDADPDQPLTVGFVARDDTNVIFVSGVAGECPGQTGLYGADVDGGTLTLMVVDDPCAARADWFQLPFTAED